MKAKHILTAIALPAMLAACSQDEDLSGALSQKDYSNVPTVDVAFTASVNENSQTRMATKFGWELGDKIGLAWLGDGTTITADGKAYQNHPLFCTDAATASFETKTMLYVGKYYAYMPYNEDIKNIEEVVFNVTGQELATTSASYAKKAIYISPKLTELKATPVGDEEGAGMGKNVKLDISQLSNAATVNLTFGNASKFADLKVMGISVDAQATTSSVLPTSFKYAPTADATVTDWKEVTTTNILALTGGGFFNGAGTGPATATTGAITATSKEGLAVANNKLTTYILTLPATATADGLEVTITTNYGDVVVDLTKKGADGKVDAIVLKDKGNDGVKTIANAKIFNNFGAAGSIDVYVDMDNLTVPAEVATQAELNNVLNTLVTKGEESAQSITVNPAEPNATNTVDLADFTFPEGLKCAVTLTAGNNASAGFAFKGNTVINSQLTLASTASVAGTMTIKNIVNEDDVQQTTLTTTASEPLTINAGAKLINEGKIDNVSSATIVISAKSSTIAAAEFVSNAESATVTSDGTFTNNGKVQWIAGELPTIAAGVIYTNVTTLDQLVAASAAFPGSGTATNEVIIDGSLSMGGLYMNLDFANIKKMTIKGDVTLNMKGSYTVTNLAAINVESGSLKFIEGANASFTPKAGCTLALSKGTELSVASGITLDLGTGGSSISFGGATVTNDGTIKTGSISGSGTWSGNGYTPAV